MSGQTTTYRRPSVSIGVGLDGADYTFLTKKTADSTGFFIQFNVPFKRADVFTELLSDEGQLGCDGADAGLTFKILKPGREAGKLVWRATISTPSGGRAGLLFSPCRLPTTHANAPQVSSGCVRETTFGSPVWGRTVTELREIKVGRACSCAHAQRAHTRSRAGDDHARLHVSTHMGGSRAWSGARPAHGQGCCMRPLACVICDVFAMRLRLCVCGGSLLRTSGGQHWRRRARSSTLSARRCAIAWVHGMSPSL